MKGTLFSILILISTWSFVFIGLNRTLGDTYINTNITFIGKSSFDEKKCTDCHKNIIKKNNFHSAEVDACKNCHHANGKEHPQDSVKGFSLPSIPPKLCYSCNDVHASKNKHLILDRLVFGNWEMKINYKSLENGGSCLTGCHAEKEYDWTKEFISDSDPPIFVATNNKKDEINKQFEKTNSLKKSVKQNIIPPVLFKETKIPDKPDTCYIINLPFKVVADESKQPLKARIRNEKIEIISPDGQLLNYRVIRYVFLSSKDDNAPLVRHYGHRIAYSVINILKNAKPGDKFYIEEIEIANPSKEIFTNLVKPIILTRIKK